MYAFIFVLLLAAGSTWSAQFSSLSTNDDGSVLYFVSNLKEKGTDQPGWGKVFRATGSGIQLYSLIQRDPADPNASVAFTNFYDIAFTEVSGDSRLVSRTASKECVFGGTYCQRTNIPVTYVDGGVGAGVSFGGRLRLSANGKYGLLQASNLYDSSISIVDPTTGSTLVSGSNPCNTGPIYNAPGFAEVGRVISDSGVAVFRCSSDTWTLSAADGARLVFKNSPSTPVMNASGSHLYYTEWLEQDRFALRSFDLASRTEGSVTVAELGVPMIAAVDNSGNRILLLATDSSGRKQAYLANRTGPLSALTDDANGILAATLSGDGQVCYIETGAGQVFRMDLRSGNALELIHRTMSTGNTLYAAPGSAVTLRGAGLAGTTVAATGDATTSLGGFRLRIDDRYAAVLAVSPSAVTIQVPPDLPADPTSALHSVEIESDLDPQFVPVVKAHLTYLGQMANAIHGDFSTFVSETAPATLGEIVHFFGTGLGPVDPALPLGVVAPNAPLSMLRGGLTCTALEGTASGWIEVPVPVLYAGLAPGTIGYYQVSVRLPSAYTTNVGVPGYMSIDCRGALASFSALLRYRV